MPENVEGKKVFSLLEVSRSIQKTLTQRYSSTFWVKAEMNKLNHYIHSGHCYPTLVEKKDGKIVAQMHANIWKNDYIRINNNFLKILKEPLKDDIKILFLSNISYSTTHGLSLRIIDIDPSYTMGDLEQEKQETIRRLTQEGLFNLNKSLELPCPPQRIAVISVETSKGYKDFLGKIHANAYGYAFFYMLFPSVLQGEKIVASITTQLHRIEKVQEHFDLVAIIRGGGGEIGLSSYNNYALAKAIATFPKPVLTGIGHITNETVAEMVAYKNLITPTDLADFLIQKFTNLAVPLNETQKKVNEASLKLLHEKRSSLQSETKLFRSVANHKLQFNQNLIKHALTILYRHSIFILKSKHTALLNLKEAVRKSVPLSFQNTRKAIALITQEVRKNTFAITHTFHIIIKQYLRPLKKSVFTVKNEREKLNLLKTGLHNKSLHPLKNQKKDLAGVKSTIYNVHPNQVLKRGFSITRYKGKALTGKAQVDDGAIIETTLHSGVLKSVVKKTKNT